MNEKNLLGFEAMARAEKDKTLEFTKKGWDIYLDKGESKWETYSS